MTHSTAAIQNLLEQAGLTEGDLLGLVEDELAPGEAAAIVTKLAASPALGELVWSMREDRESAVALLEPEMRRLEPERDLIEASVAVGVSGALPAELVERIESTGVERSRVHLHRLRTRTIRGTRRHRRIPSRLSRTLGGLLTTGVSFGLALGLIVGLGWVIVGAWPTGPAAPTGPAGPGGSGVPGGIASAPGPSAGSVPAGDGAPRAIAMADAQPDDPEAGVPADGTITAAAARISSAAEALAAAREGRLVIRVVSADGSAARSVVESITTQPSVSRVAVLEGRMHDRSAVALAGAMPEDEPVIYASELAAASAERPGRPRRLATDAYMLEVEPTERGFSLLLAGLRRDPGVLVQLVRSGEPITTPGSVDDAVWYRSPSRDWRPRIAAPVLVESLRSE